ncbi:MAG: FtsW/RodA/SpoVE family cell cycle protein [bacterium]|nr:FtsW/RodA/SpoVE family cell cycle protein [bacterium]
MRFFRGVDWVLALSAVVLSLLGLAAMKSFVIGNGSTILTASDYYFNRQILWLILSILVFITALLIDWEFLKTNSIILLFFYLVALVFLAVLLLGGGSIVKGAESWYKVYSIALQPVELMKIILVLVLAKYFSRRHVEIARFFHIFASGIYAAVPVILVILQPDFGSAFIISALWLGMALIGGIKVRHILLLFGTAVIAGVLVWNFVFLPYQKSRILTFLEPASDIRGAGYHALQSTIAVGSGEILGKGIGFGTQSRLSFLPEKESDFIFAAFAEEWGLIGVLIIFLFFGIMIWRILRAGIYGESNFEKLYAAGLAILFVSQASIHVGMNMGLLPITGLGMPFMSYGGSSLVSSFLAIGILESFSIRKKGIFIGMEERFKEGVF